MPDQITPQPGSGEMRSTGRIARARRILAENRVPVLVGALASTNILRLASNLILTRLLAPEAFGVIGLIAAINVVFAMVTDMGFGAFVVRSKKAMNRRFLDFVWTVRLVRSLILTIVVFASAGLLAAAFDKPELEGPIRAASFMFLFEGLRSAHQFIAQRQQRVSYVTTIEFVAFALQTAITLVAAWFIGNFWAIILGMYAAGAINVLFSYTFYPGGRHRIVYNREYANELWRFARLIIASSTITLILSQADKIFIGRALDLETLGLYMLAVNLVGAARALIQTYSNRVLFPLYAQTHREDPAALPQLYYTAKRRMTLTLAFLLGGGFGAGTLIVRILLDDRYVNAGIFVSLLCLGPLFLLVNKAAESHEIAIGRPRSAVEASFTCLVWIIITAPIGFHLFGILGLVAAFALIEAAASIYWWLRLKKAGVLQWREELTMLSLAALGAALGISADWSVSKLIQAGWLPYF